MGNDDKNCCIRTAQTFCNIFISDLYYHADKQKCRISCNSIMPKSLATCRLSHGEKSNHPCDLISSIHQALDLHLTGCWENEWLGDEAYIEIVGLIIISLRLKAMEREVALVKTDQSVIPRDVNEAAGLVMNVEVRPKDELSPLSSVHVAQNAAWSLPSRHSRCASQIHHGLWLLIDCLCRTPGHQEVVPFSSATTPTPSRQMPFSTIRHPSCGPQSSDHTPLPPALWITLRAGCYSWCHITYERWYFNWIELF